MEVQPRMKPSHKAVVLVWAHARNITGFDEIQVVYHPEETPLDILKRCTADANALAFCRIAVDQAIHPWDQPVGVMREMAVIPPVSGG